MQHTPYILVVDDNKITARLLRRYLEGSGFQAGEAHDGVECLESVAARTPDTIIMDVMMPRMDGLETTQALKANELFAHVPIVIVTALNDVATQSRAVDAGADDFLTKPIEEKLLIAKVRLYTQIVRLQQRIQHLQGLIRGIHNGSITAAEAVATLETTGS